ncbi:MAG: FtsX-like permease family protein [Candidatus Nanopelagicales bacterium]
MTGGTALQQLSADAERAFVTDTPRPDLIVPARDGAAFTSADLAAADRVAEVDDVTAQVPQDDAPSVALMAGDDRPYLGSAVGYVADDPSGTAGQPLSRGDVVLDPETAQVLNLAVGSHVGMRGWQGDVRTFRVSGLTEPGSTPVPSQGATVGLPLSDLRWAAGPDVPTNLMVTAAPDADTTRVRDDLARAGYPAQVTSDATWNEAHSDTSSGAIYVIFGMIVLIVLLMGLLAVSTALGASIAASRKDFACLRALGIPVRRVRRILRTQALLATGLGTVIGVALGACATLALGMTPGIGFLIVGATAGLVAGAWGMRRGLKQLGDLSPLEALGEAETADNDLAGGHRRLGLKAAAPLILGVACCAVGLVPGPSMPIALLVGGILLMTGVNVLAPAIASGVSSLWGGRFGSDRALTRMLIKGAPVRSGRMIGFAAAGVCVATALSAMLITGQELASASEVIDNNPTVLTFAPRDAGQVYDALYSRLPSEAGFTYPGNPSAVLVAPSSLPQAEAALSHVTVENVGTAQSADIHIDRSQSVFDAAMRTGMGLAVGATVLTLVGFLASSIAAMKQRAAQHTMLRAVGLRRRRLTRVLSAEGGVLAAVGAVLGAAAGLALVNILFLGIGGVSLTAVLCALGLVAATTVAGVLGAGIPAIRHGRNRAIAVPQG